jgi:hypothetical protein
MNGYLRRATVPAQVNGRLRAVWEGGAAFYQALSAPIGEPTVFVMRRIGK